MHEMKLEMRLEQYQEEPEETQQDVSPYLENEVPTQRVPYTREFCLSESRRAETFEEEGYWLLMSRSEP